MSYTVGWPALLSLFSNFVFHFLTTQQPSMCPHNKTRYSITAVAFLGRMNSEKAIGRTQGRKALSQPALSLAPHYPSYLHLKNSAENNLNMKNTTANT